MLNFDRTKPYEKVAEKRYEYFKIKRIIKNAKKPLVIVLFFVTICFGTYVGDDLFLESYSNEKLFDEYFKCYNISNDKTCDYMQAIQNYKNNNFDLAIKYFTEISQKDTLSLSNSFYLAISYAKCDRYYKAIDLFKKITINENSGYRNSSNWYLGLCYLQVHKNEKAREYFELLIKEENLYKEDAFKVLKKMRN